jgi:hypothetical protein
VVITFTEGVGGELKHYILALKLTRCFMLARSITNRLYEWMLVKEDFSHRKERERNKEKDKEKENTYNSASISRNKMMLICL